MSSCLACRAQIEPFIDFGSMPIANNFPTREGFEGEHFFQLGVARCLDCELVQLTELVESTRMFHEHYAYFSSTSKGMIAHFRAFADSTRAALEPRGAAQPFVIELGSNDGIMLQHLEAAGLRALGVEPSANVAAVARARGLDTHVAFFSAALAQQLREAHGPADGIVGANVLCHVEDINDVLEGVRRLLAPRGVFCFEDPYLPEILTRGAFDQFYEEHVLYFRARSVAKLAARHELELVDVEAQAVHGGSMRYTLAPAKSRAASPRVAALLEREAMLGLDTPAPYEALATKVAHLATQLRETLEGLRDQGKRVMGYGATAKSSTMINYAGLGPELIESICDVTPAKQGRFSPGAHIPIVSYERFSADYPDVALLFAWNHATEIFAKEQAFEDAGGQWLTYLPEVGLGPSATLGRIASPATR